MECVAIQILIDTNLLKIPSGIKFVQRDENYKLLKNDYYASHKQY